MTDIPHLADVNLLIALADRSSPWHLAAHEWLASQEKAGWCTCPTVENGFVRISSNQNYASRPVQIKEAIQSLNSIRSRPGHRFVPDDYSQFDGSDIVDSPISHHQVTDCYLVKLCRRHGLKLATFDSKMRYLPNALQPFIHYL